MSSLVMVFLTLPMMKPLAAAGNYPAVIEETPGLVGYWRFEEESGSTVTDSAGKHYGRVEMAKRVVVGLAGRAVRFDGERSLVYLFRSPGLEPRTGDFTIEFWCRTDELGRNDSSYLLASKMSPFGHGNGGWYLTLRKDGTLHMRITESLERQIVAETKEPVVAADKWHYVAAVRSANVVRLYVNGRLVGEGAGPLGVDARIYGDILLGGSAWGNRFPGLIDEAAYYNAALPADAIERHFQAAGVEP